jgi:hypothetical protein
MTSYLAWELIFLIAVGLLGGTWLGILVSGLWVPHFRVGAGTIAEALPLSARVAWSAILGFYVLFGLLLIVVLVLSVVITRRFKISDAVKLVETA